MIILMVLLRIIDILLSVFSIMLLIRAILSWFSDGSDPVSRFLITVTEPVLAPVRRFLMRFEFFRNLPIDFSMLVVLIIIWIIRAII